MQNAIIQVIEQIQKLAKDNNFKTKYKTQEKDFTRTRKISFPDAIFFILGLSNTSFDFERINFCKVSNIGSISNAALSKVRDKINYLAFRELLTQTQELIPTTTDFKGFRVIAVDGMKGELPNTPQIMEKYKPSKKALYPIFHAVASFDVLNCKFIDAEFEMSPTNERQSALNLIDKHLPQNDIFLFDRGFPSVALIQKLEEKQLYYVARVSTSFINEVNKFATQKYLDKTIHIEYTKERARTSKIKNLNVPYSFDLRCVRVSLPKGAEEILITNLPNDTFKRKDIEKLYRLRWRIETSFNHLKNAINVEEFVGIKENSIKQEFYSVLIKYNLVMQYVDEAKTVEYYLKKTKIRI